MAIKKTERKPRVSRVPEGETKEQKFIRLATRRVNKVRKALDSLGALGGSQYASTDHQREKIVEVLQESLQFNINRLNKTKLSQTDFTL